MKKLIFPSVLMLGLTLFSFTAPSNGGVKKIGEQLYEVSSDVKFSDSEKQLINDLIVQEYRLSEAQLKAASVEGIELDALNRSWIFKRKFSFDVIDERFLVWDSEAVISEQAEKVIAVLDSYTR